MPFVAMAAYTEGTIYEVEADKLRRSCEARGIELDLYPFASLGRWQSNVRYRIHKILPEALERHNPKDVWMLDADMVILQWPKAFDNFDGDIGVVSRHSGREFFGSGIYFRNNAAVREFVQRWGRALSEAPPDMLSQKVLSRLLNSQYVRERLKIVVLPDDYAVIPIRFYKNRQKLCSPVVVDTHVSMSVHEQMNTAKDGAA